MYILVLLVCAYSLFVLFDFYYYFDIYYHDNQDFSTPRRDKPIIKFFGVSRRAQRGQYLSKNFNVKWGESGKYDIDSMKILSNLLQKLRLKYTIETMVQHQKDAALHLLANRDYLCPVNSSKRTGFVWIEDDAIECDNTIEHIYFIFDFLEEISMSPVNSPLRRLVYIRTSYGFNGLVVRCERFHKFVLAIVKVGDKLGIDDLVASFLDKQIAVYRWNLFAHPKSIPRDDSVARCYDYNFNTMVYNDYYLSECLFFGSLLSPCQRFVWSDINLQKNKKLIPKPPIMLNQDDLAFDHSNELITMTPRNETCDQVCQLLTPPKNCSFKGIMRLSKLLRVGIIPKTLNCFRITFNSFTGMAFPRFDHTTCVTRLVDGDDPELFSLARCDVPFIRRICVCVDY